VAIEDKLKLDPYIEENNSKFQAFAFDSHVDAYENAGLFGLPLSDLYKIGMTPDIFDLISPNGLRQAKEVAGDYVDYAEDNKLLVGLKILKFAAQIYNNSQSSEEEGN